MKDNNTASDLQETITKATQGPVPGVFYVDPSIITQYVDNAVRDMVRQSLEFLMQDEAWVERIKNLVSAEVSGRFVDRLSSMDINTMVADNLDAALVRHHERILSNFSTAGIRDAASQCELVISDGAVVAQSGLACKELLVDHTITTNDINVQNLAVLNSVNHSGPAWADFKEQIAQAAGAMLNEEWRTNLVQQVIELARTSGIDFDSVSIRGAPLVEGSRLSANITETSIQRVGMLRDLSVAGAAHLARTVHVDNNRVGINTESPDMALTVWDEEVSVSVGKIRQDRAWIGSNRQQAMDIGINRKRAISIESDGLVVMDRVRLDRWQISFGNSVPNYSGTRGDIVFNHDPKPNTPWAWQCLGGFKWQALGTA